MAKPLLLIDFEATGHHALYVRHLVRFGMDKAQISFLISRELCARVLSQLPEPESSIFLKHLKIIEEDRAWCLIRKWIKNDTLARFIYVEHLNFCERHNRILFFLFFESVFYAIALSPLPRFNVSGLMFRPTFYYRQRGMLGRGTRTRSMFLIKSVAAYACAKRPGISRIVTLDPLARDYARSRWNCPKFEVVPDPLGPEAETQRPVAVLQEGHRQSLTLLIAGVLGPRKGIRQVVQALLCTSEELRARVTLAIVGELEQAHACYVWENIDQLRQNGVKVIADLRLITDKELDSYIEASDVVLTAYRNFKGSSGILIRSAHFGKPVISTHEGLLGYFVKHHKLGRAIDIDDPRAFAACLEAFMQTGSLTGFDPVGARRFADHSNPETFAAMLLQLPAANRQPPAIAG